MPTYWFDVFTAETWEEARLRGFDVSGFSESKKATVQRIADGDILICYLKGAKKLVGALRVIGKPYFANQPRIWASGDFPARVNVEPIITIDMDRGIDIVPILPELSIYDPSNMKSTWARFQGSPTRLDRRDGELLLACIQDGNQIITPLIVPKPASSKVRHIKSEQNNSSTEASSHERLKSVNVLVAPMTGLIEELTKAQRDAAHPARFEQAVTEVFAFLGLEAQRYGQPNKTDVIVNSQLGHERFRVIIDAKASTNGKVPEGQINWAAVSGHRQQASADYAAIVGEKFAGGNLLRFAQDFNIALIETVELVDILRLYAKTPFPAADLRPLFATAGQVTAVVADLRQKSQATERHWQLVAEIIRLVADFSRLDPPLIPTTGNLHAVLVSRALAGNREDVSPPAEQDVRDAVTFLANRTVGILRSVEPDTSGYRLATSEYTALRRLRALDTAIHTLLAGNVTEDRKWSEERSMP